MANTDNRKSKRSPVTLRIKFKSANLDQFIERYAVDVSQGGIFIRTKKPLDVGTSLRFEFQLRDESPLITGEGTVVWIREPTPNQTGVAPGMGVRFDRLTESSQAVLDEILAYKAARGDGVPGQMGEAPTRVVTSPLAAAEAEHARSGPIAFAGEGVPEEAFEQSTKVHSLEELASLTAGLDAADAASSPGLSDFLDGEDDKTKVYPAMARPKGSRPGSAGIDLGHSGSTQPLPATPLMPQSEVELGRAGYDEPVAADEPIDARDVELGMAGPTEPLMDARMARPDEVELGFAGAADGLRKAAPARAPSAARPVDLGPGGSMDPMSDVPLPEPGHFDLGQAGPTAPLSVERAGRGAELELGAAGSSLDDPMLGAGATVPAPVPGDPRAPASAGAHAGARAASHDDVRAQVHERAPAPPEPAPGAVAGGAVADSGQLAVDELEARRMARKDAERAAAGDEPGAAVAAGGEPGAAAVAEPAARSSSARVVTARKDTALVSDRKKGLPLLPIAAAVALAIIVIGGGAFYMLSRGDGQAGTATQPPGTTDPSAFQTQATTDTPDTRTGTAAGTEPGHENGAGAAVAEAGEAADAAVEEPEVAPEVAAEAPEVPIETAEVLVRATPRGATATLVGGDQEGPTPFKLQVDESKKHRVRVSHPGYVSQEIEIDPAEPRTRWINLEPVPWIIRIDSTPREAIIYVNGRRVPGHTPNELVLPAGWEKRQRHKVSFRMAGYEKLDLVVERDFQEQGEAMVQSVRGTLVKDTTPEPPEPAAGSGSDGRAPDRPSGGQSGGEDGDQSGGQSGGKNGDQSGGEDGDQSGGDSGQAAEGATGEQAAQPGASQEGSGDDSGKSEGSDSSGAQGGGNGGGEAGGATAASSPASPASPAANAAASGESAAPPAPRS